MNTLEYTENGWRVATDTTRHHRERRWDYKGKGIYHITLTIAERYPLFGELVGDTPEQAQIRLTDFGHQVWKIVTGLPSFYAPKGYALKIIAVQMMPDHMHVVLQVIEPLPRSIGSVIRSFKCACTSAFKREQSSDKNIAEMQNILHFSRIFARTNSIWESNPAFYHERILHAYDQLQALVDYVHDNPRRLWLKRAHPDLFRIHQQTQIADIPCTTLGNMFLASYPQRVVLQCSRHLTQDEIDTRKDECLDEAANGSVFISAAVSEGEKQIARALGKAGYPLIILLEKGFPKPEDPHYKFFKPSGVYFEACAAGRLLLIEPHPDLFESPEIIAQVTAKAGNLPHDALRYRFLALNVIAALLAPSRE